MIIRFLKTVTWDPSQHGKPGMHVALGLPYDRGFERGVVKCAQLIAPDVYIISAVSGGYPYDITVTLHLPPDVVEVVPEDDCRMEQKPTFTGDDICANCLRPWVADPGDGCAWPEAHVGKKP